MARAKLLSTKVIVANLGALREKYRAAGVARIQAALADLVKADRKRGIATRIVYLDRAHKGWRRVTDPHDPRENKRAIDGVHRALRPDYLVLLGSVDVIPYQELKNPLYDPQRPDLDDDVHAASDLPYACDAAFSTSIQHFLGPTRVVGRIPDLTGATNPGYLLKLLRTAASARRSPAPAGAFALSAQAWARSTRKSIRLLLGTTPKVLTSPRSGPRHLAKALSANVHFVNCHGDRLDPCFYGEDARGKMPVSLDSALLKGVRKGTVAAFECCFGAELYPPSDVDGSPSVSNAYLAAGSYGVVASTTIAYGPADDVANADIICRVFLERLLEGASLGRAFVEARQALVARQSVVDPYNAKTLAQFVLLGDPSIHPFEAIEEVADRKADPNAAAARSQRRVRLMKMGDRLARTSAFTVSVRKPDSRSARLGRELAKKKRGFGRVRPFVVRDPDGGAGAAGPGKGKRGPRGQRVFVALRRRRTSRDSVALVGLLAYEVSGRLVTLEYVSR